MFDDEKASYEVVGWLALGALIVSALLSVAFIVAIIWGVIKLVSHFTA